MFRFVGVMKKWLALRFVTQFLCSTIPQKELCAIMQNKELTFNDLPQVVAQLRDEVMGMKVLLQSLQNNRPTQQRENRHRPVTPERVAEYTNIPLATIYQKLANGEIPGTKPGKRWVIYLDEIDKWLEVNRKNPIPLTDAEINEGIKKSNRRKPKAKDWMEDASVSDVGMGNDGNMVANGSESINESEANDDTNPNNGEA